MKLISYVDYNGGSLKSEVNTKLELYTHVILLKKIVQWYKVDFKRKLTVTELVQKEFQDSYRHFVQSVHFFGEVEKKHFNKVLEWTTSNRVSILNYI